MFGGKIFCYFGPTNQISSGNVSKIYVTKKFSELYDTFGEKVTYPCSSFYGYKYQVIEDENENCLCIYTDHLSPCQTVSQSPTETESHNMMISESIDFSVLESESEFTIKTNSPSSQTKSVTETKSVIITESETNVVPEPGPYQGRNNKIFLKAWNIAIIAIGSCLIVGILCAVGIFFFIEIQKSI